MTVRMKRGVVMCSSEPYYFEMIEAAKMAYSSVGVGEVVITSGIEGTHAVRSFHYIGRALDFRTSMLTDSQRSVVHDRLRQTLGVEYDVVFEGDHFHIEYDPKET